MSAFFRPRGLQHARPPCPSPTPEAHSFMSRELVTPSKHIILCHPLLSCLQSSLASGPFPMSHFASGGQSIGASFSTSVWFSSDQLLSRVWLFVTPWIAALQASLSITNSRSLLKLMSIKSVMPSSHLILCLRDSSVFFWWFPPRVLPEQYLSRIQEFIMCQTLFYPN